MDSLRSLLPKVLRKRGLHGQAVSSLVTFRAKQWLDRELPALADMFEVKSYANAILTIACGNSIAAEECHFLLPSLQEHLSRECSGIVLTEIRLIRGKK
jgi:hypothetical protein